MPRDEILFKAPPAPGRASSAAALAAKEPEAHARAAARLSGRPVAIRVDGERFVVEVAGAP
ncbi:hypothetical protein [Sorangium sp. So ce887]|uniref:hypothetical protein n=1 Tax=Sorangium sp. So ce887 TaxID=3133324 RepID=UPI003F61340D